MVGITTDQVIELQGGSHFWKAWLQAKWLNYRVDHTSGWHDYRLTYWTTGWITLLEGMTTGQLIELQGGSHLLAWLQAKWLNYRVDHTSGLHDYRPTDWITGWVTSLICMTINQQFCSLQCVTMIKSCLHNTCSCPIMCLVLVIYSFL